MTLNQNELLIRRLFQLFNNRQWDEIVELYDEKVALLHPFKRDCFIEKNRWNMPVRYAALERKYATVMEEINFIEAAGNIVFVQYTTKGFNKNGEAYSLPAWSIYTIENGKITKDASYISTPLSQAA